MTNEMHLNMTSNICEHEQSVQGTWPESYMKRRVSNMISELDKLIKKNFWGLVCYLEPSEGWSHLECGLDVEDWELSSRSKVEISGEDSINQEKKRETQNYFCAKNKTKGCSTNTEFTTYDQPNDCSFIKIQ